MRHGLGPPDAEGGAVLNRVQRESLNFAGLYLASAEAAASAHMLECPLKSKGLVAHETCGGAGGPARVDVVGHKMRPRHSVTMFSATVRG